jgi:hypothetical protein
MRSDSRDAGVRSERAFPGYGEEAPLDLPSMTPRLEAEVAQLMVSGGFEDWSTALARVGNCARPVRLHGQSLTVDATTGEVLSRYASTDEPLGVTHVRCGNRRASVCPACSRVYAADTFHLIRAGIAGGKGVPAEVADNPLVFATLTAPSFGHVHGHRDGQVCRPGSPRSPRGGSVCRHGRPMTCSLRHRPDDPMLGQALCPGCYDYEGQVTWQWWAPELWKRFTIALRRSVAKFLDVPAARLADVATLQYAKVAEFQRRGVIHFHALIRLDGPKTPNGFARAPVTLDVDALGQLVVTAAARTRLSVPHVDDADPARVLAFGRQVDVRSVVTRPDDPDCALSPAQVAGYLAKYATKAADDLDVTAGDNRHLRRLRATIRSHSARASAQEQITGDTAYAKLGGWTHMLGFRGHFGTKSRRYSTTLTALRRARRRAQSVINQARARGEAVDLAALEADLLAEDDHDTTLVIGSWAYAGTGWSSDAQTVLATAAAARAREHDQWQAERRRTYHSERT